MINNIYLRGSKWRKTVNDSDVTVFALMDYWTFDWYFKVLDSDIKKTIFN